MIFRIYVRVLAWLGLISLDEKGQPVEPEPRPPTFVVRHHTKLECEYMRDLLSTQITNKAAHGKDWVLANSLHTMFAEAVYEFEVYDRPSETAAAQEES